MTHVPPFPLHEVSDHDFTPSGDFLNAANFGATGSDFVTKGRMEKDSFLLVLEEEGDFREGNYLSFDGAYFHIYGTVVSEGAPYLAKYQTDLNGELEAEGLEEGIFQQTFVLHFHGDGTFSFLAADPKHQTMDNPEASVTRFWKFQGEHLPVTETWQALTDGVKIRFRRKEWKKGAIIALHVTSRLTAKILKKEGNFLTLDRAANCDAEGGKVAHMDQIPLQNCVDAAIKEHKNVYIPAGHYRLSDGLTVFDCSMTVAGAGPELTVLDISEAHTACFWVGGGREFVLKDLAMVGSTPYDALPCCRPFITDAGYGYWPTANQQMECHGSAALNLSGTEFVLCENLSVSRMGSEALYLHGSDRGGRHPFIQKPHEGLSSIEKQYTKQCIFRRCRVFNCGFNAFNNNDFAENTLIESCHVENVGNFCENAARFTRVLGNYVYNAHTLTLCAIRSPKEFTGLSQAIVSGNVFEGGRQNRGLGIGGDEVIVSSNTFSGFSKSTAIDVHGRKVVLSGNIVDLTQDSFCPDHWRDGVNITGRSIIVSDNHIGLRGGKGKEKTAGIAICECARNLLVHDNFFQSCACGIRSGTRMAVRVYEEDPTSSSWDRPYEALSVKITKILPGGKYECAIPEYLLGAPMLEGDWVAVDAEGKEILLSPLSLTGARSMEFTAKEGVFSEGKTFRIYPKELNWNFHDNVFLDCDKNMEIDLPFSRGIKIRD
ncbi:MAG: right-handed parallel beta-helix repeat-containing protein [Lentisphaeria bacterium]|nr:right-handed parallel beta-helix repeat-containing protein [Lentisphaeria bacterium]